MKTVVAALIENQGFYFVAQRAKGQKLEGFWEFPGGKLEKNESIEQCIIREIKEELNIKIVPKNIFSETIYEYEFGKIKLIGVISDIVEGNLELRVHSQYKWLKPVDILKITLAPADIPIAQKLSYNQ
ncbi:(deoxy)nucleoside triphosphate pyrophosphohydrolase [Pigmentibacter ruber]|uniref:(deoxy)nucleoside triphosphate pyrophosphohydrolase n=1 Tax=Pigmentibacter ruber TaxID=2683196 RepID=UPI00131ECFF8|nr:(deoxy)nucleoside triphosphate pyrophosphohydrolase [Pigmentibacter ruber]BFD31463.1 8-oxo-dGTP diphosphatase MutT [Pigmentibacter ruber]